MNKIQEYNLNDSEVSRASARHFWKYKLKYTAIRKIKYIIFEIKKYRMISVDFSV